DGFSVEIINGRVTIVAEANTSAAERTGEIEFVLEEDTSKKIVVSLTQSVA
ncbi:BACON domain-containing carbohydrate-binding protein, partial [uncultured Alistipes sp.]|uniref:BACON domain-containing carbohydrate-binding protein n=2 Tax=uncultured Alistipes sp. TaxID=538949 RepID=UPI0034E94C58